MAVQYLSNSKLAMRHFYRYIVIAFVLLHVFVCGSFLTIILVIYSMYSLFLPPSSKRLSTESSSCC